MAFIFIAAAVLLLLIFPVFLGVSAYFDINRKYATVTLSLFGVKAIRISVREIEGSIFYTVNNGEAKKIEKERGDSGAAFLKIMKKIKTKRAIISARIGTKDAATTALTVAAARALFEKLNIETRIIPDYAENTTVTAQIKIIVLPIKGVIDYGIAATEKSY